MAVGVTRIPPITAMRAVFRIEEAKRAAVELTNHEQELLAKFWHAALTAAASVDANDYETLTGYRVYRGNLHSYYRMLSGMVEEVLREILLERRQSFRNSLQSGNQTTSRTFPSSADITAKRLRSGTNQVTWEGGSPLVDVCRATKQNGPSCTLPARSASGYCWAHDPSNREQRSRVALRAGNSPRLYGVPPQRVKTRI